jgi:hypothetical protein
MKSINLISIKYIQITFQYLSQYITINSEIQKTLKQIKNKAINKMIGVPKEVYCLYLGENLTKKENEKIGNLFNHKEKVLIILKLPSFSSLPNYKIHKRNKEFVSLSLNNSKKININTFFSNSNNSIISNNKKAFPLKFESPHLNFKKQKKLKIIDKIPNSKDFINISRNPKSPKEISNSSRSLILEKSLPPLKVNSLEINQLCSCKKYPISEYCRTCGKFICNDCRISDKHKTHLSIHLDMFNYKQNIISYGKLLQNEITTTLDLNKNIRYNSVDENSTYKLEEDELNEKYDKAIDKYFKTINAINNYISKQDPEKAKLKIDAYNKSSLNIQKEIDILMSKFKNNKEKTINLNYLEHFFRDLSTKEETLLFLQKDILKYHILNEINVKMKSSINKIDKTLNEISDKKNPFNLGNKYQNELINMKVIKSDIEEELQKKKQLKEEIRKKSIIIGGHIINKVTLMKRRSNIFILNDGKNKKK